jgi:hypothetical protein
MKPWSLVLTLALVASCRSASSSGGAQASKGEQITFIVHGPVQTGELQGDHFCRFVVSAIDGRKKTIRIPLLDGSSTNAVCSSVRSGFEERDVPSLEPTTAEITTPRGIETAASFVMRPPWHLATVTVERREGGGQVLDMSQLEVRRDGYPMPNTPPSVGAMPSTISK